MKHLVVIIIALILTFPGPLTAEETGGDQQATLLIVDIQGFYFEDGSLALEGSLEASREAKKILDRFRELGWPVIHVQHLPKGQDLPSQQIEPEPYRIHANVAPKKGETVIGKHHANAFRDTRLLEILRELGAHRLVIIGMQTHMCLEAATRAAADLGFDVTVVHDSCATRDLDFGGTTVPAAQVHASTLASLEGSYAEVISTEDFLGGISGKASASENQ